MASIFETRTVDLSGQEDARLADYLSLLVESWRIITVITAIALLLGTLYAFLAPPIYRADAMFQVEDNAGSTKDALGELASIFDTKATAAAEIELIRSRLVVGETVHRLHLDVTASPRYFPILGSWMARRSVSGELAQPWFGLSQFAWGGESIAVTQFDVPQEWYEERFTLVAGNSGTFDLQAPDGDLILHGRVGEPAHGRLQDGDVTLTLTALGARPGTQFVVTRASTLKTIEKLRESLSIAEKTKQSGVIGVALDGSQRKRTSETINTIAQQYVQQNIDRKSAEAERTLAFLEQQLPQLRAELDKAEDRYNTFRNRKGTVDLAEESRLLLQQIVDAKTKTVELQQQRFELAQRFTESHPAVAALGQQISALQGEQDTLNRRVSTLPDTEQTALRLLRDVQVDTQLYTNLLNSAQQLRIVKAGQIGNVRVVDYAVNQEEPVSPKKPLVIVLSAIFGVALGVVTAFVRKILYGGVEHSAQIEQAVGVPVYAVIPHSDRQGRLQESIRRGGKGQHVLALHAPDDIAIEGIRSLRTSLQFARLDAPNNVVMVTGPRPEVGKSFLSSNLAVVLASSGQRILLIDGDMRRGDIHTYFGVARGPGLSDVISGRDIQNTILRDVSPGLDLLAKGTLPPNPAELLMSERFKTMLEYLSGLYDLVIIDTPPVLAVTDSTIVGKYAGITLLVVRHARQPVSEIDETVKRLRTGGVLLKGVLLTDVPQRRIGYGAYYAGYYGYESNSE